jgi:phosphotriesterase-related protein
LQNEIATIKEISYFKKAGGNSIVSLTNMGIGPDPLFLQRVSLSTGINIIAGSGYYRRIAQKNSVVSKKSDQIAREIIHSINTGIGNTKIRAGIIGEIGTSSPLQPFEKESLIGAVKAQQVTGAALNIHPEVWGHTHLDLLDIVENAGGDLTRTVLSHMDELTDSDYHLKVAERGVYLSFDTFGSEFVCDGTSEPKDEDRISCLLALLKAGYKDKIVLSHDICYKVQLKEYGGKGYDHILVNIIPRLKEMGVGDSEIRNMLVDNPEHILAFKLQK